MDLFSNQISSSKVLNSYEIKQCEIVIIKLLSVCMHVTQFTSRIGGVEATDITDAAHPLVHLLFSVCHQVKDPVDSLDVKDEAVLQVLLVECETGVHLLAQVQIDHADGLLGMVILVIL